MIHSDACVAEEVKDCVELDEAKEERPEVALLDHGEVEGQEDRGEERNGYFQVAVDEEVFDVGARSLQQGKTGDQGQH